jgi:hypothetical protein
MYAYEPILADLARQVRASYPRQVLDPRRPDHGVFLAARDNVANPDHTANGRDLAAACYCFLAEGSPLRGDDDLFARLNAAIAFQRRWQRPTGLIDLISVNWESPPDTGFTVQLLAPVVGLARECAGAGDERAATIAADLGEYVRTAALGMIGRGFHTPNHRWVVCSALAQALALFPELPARDYVERILAEGIDSNDDGEYTERSTGIYNAVCNRSLRFMADGLDRPDLLDPVRRNLDLMAHLFHDDGTVVTSISNRQDRGQRVVPISLADSFYDMARRDNNGVWAGVADRLAATAGDAPHRVWLVHPFIARPEYRRDPLPRAPLPDRFARIYPVSGLWRVKRGPLSATAAAGNTVAFAVRYGEADLKAVKIAGTYHSTAFFAADRLAATADGVRLVHEGATRRVPGYELPLARPVPFGEFAATRPTRERWTLPVLDQTLDIREVPGGFDLHLRTAGGLDRITFQIECCFAGPGEWETADQVMAVGAGQTAILKAGWGTFRRGDDAISIGPGGEAHRMWQMRGTEPEPDAFRVLITLQTPIDRTLEIRYGRWSPATGGIE